MAFLRFGSRNAHSGVDSANASTAQLLPHPSTSSSPSPLSSVAATVSSKNSKESKKEAQRLASAAEKEARRLRELQLREQARAVMRKRQERIAKEGNWQEGAICFNF